MNSYEVKTVETIEMEQPNGKIKESKIRRSTLIEAYSFIEAAMKAGEIFPGDYEIISITKKKYDEIILKKEN
jgi:hypothetical protein